MYNQEVNLIISLSPLLLAQSDGVSYICRHGLGVKEGRDSTFLGLCIIAILKFLFKLIYCGSKPLIIGFPNFLQLSQLQLKIFKSRERVEPGLLELFVL